MKINLLNFNLRECAEESGFYSDLSAFACNAKSVAIAFLVFLSFLCHLLSGRTGKSSLCIFLLFLL